MHLKTSHSRLVNRNQVGKETFNVLKVKEDTSLLDDTTTTTIKEITLDESAEEVVETLAIGCDWDPCEFKSADKGFLIKHIEDKHIKKEKQKSPKVEDILSCNLCDFETENNTALDNHIKGRKVKNFCSSTKNSQVEIDSDRKASSDVETVITEEEKAGIHEEKKTETNEEKKTDKTDKKETGSINTDENNIGKCEEKATKEGRTEEKKDEARTSEEESQLPETTFVCGTCAMGFMNQSECMKHMSTHNDFKSYKCDSCDEIFTTLLDIEWHIETTHEQSNHIEVLPFNCHKC